MTHLSHTFYEIGSRNEAVTIRAEDTSSGMAVGDWSIEMWHAKFLKSRHGKTGVYFIEYIAEVKDLEALIWHYDRR